MARMTDVGRRVTVLTLTRGEKGTSDPVDYDQPHFGAQSGGRAPVEPRSSSASTTSGSAGYRGRRVRHWSTPRRPSE